VSKLADKHTQIIMLTLSPTNNLLSLIIILVVVLVGNYGVKGLIME
jgi:hypothetical protein